MREPVGLKETEFKTAMSLALYEAGKEEAEISHLVKSRWYILLKDTLRESDVFLTAERYRLSSDTYSHWKVVVQYSNGSVALRWDADEETEMASTDGDDDDDVSGK